MKNWSAIEWCLFILTLTVPLTLISIFISKSITGVSMQPESADLVADMLKFIIGGVIGVIGVIGGMRINNKKK